MNRVMNRLVRGCSLALFAAFFVGGMVSQADGAVTWTAGYEGDFVPVDAGASPSTWAKTASPTSGASATVSGGILTLANTASSDFYAFRQNAGTGGHWTPTASGSTIEARIRITPETTNDEVAWLRVRTGAQFYNIAFGTSYVKEYGGGGASVSMDTTDDFHVYRFTIDGTSGDGKLYVDGAVTPLLTATGVANASSSYLVFGDDFAAEGHGTSEWDYLRWTNQGAFAPVPEPSSMGLLIAGIFFVVSRVKPLRPLAPWV